MDNLTKRGIPRSNYIFDSRGDRNIIFVSIKLVGAKYEFFHISSNMSNNEIISILLNATERGEIELW